MEQVRGRALKKEEQEQVDIAQKVLDVLKSDKDVRCAAPRCTSAQPWSAVTQASSMKHTLRCSNSS